MRDDDAASNMCLGRMPRFLAFTEFAFNTVVGGAACQILPATSSTRILYPRFSH